MIQVVGMQAPIWLPVMHHVRVASYAQSRGTMGVTMVIVLGIIAALWHRVDLVPII